MNKKDDINNRWIKKVKELEEYFKLTKIPLEFIFKPHGHVRNSTKFINSHIEYAKNNIGNMTYLPFVLRLIDLKNKIQNDSITSN